MDLLNNENITIELVEPDIVEQVIIEPVILEPVILESEPVILESEIVEPVILEPVILEPVILEPVILEPVILEPEIVEPEIVEPEIVEPEIVEPEIVEPEIVEPEPEIVEPEPEIVEPEPEIVEPIIIEPTILEHVVLEPVPLSNMIIEPAIIFEPVVLEYLIMEPALIVEPEIVESVPEIVESVPEIVESVPEIVESVPEIVESVPKLIFIVPYRDRVQQLQFFKSHMKLILGDIPETDYKIYFSNQQDSRTFNRGAMKNIGFLTMKQKYPNDYQNITFVFNDVDTMPFTKNFLNYNTTHGVVKHFYGYKFALGGIVSLKGSDFEKINGFPNFWAWGFEDNLLQMRALNAKLTIDRSQFYPIMDKNIFQMKDGLERLVNRNEFDRFISDTPDGLRQISSLLYNIDEDTGFINITKFNTETNDNPTNITVHDLRNGGRPFTPNVIQLKGKSNRRPTMGMFI
jgi:hypothetical protein